MKDYEFKISQFVDNELSANEQQELFRFLSDSHEAQQTLIDYMAIKNEAKSFYSGLHTEMGNSKTITAGIIAQNEREKKYKTMFYFSVAASIIFVFLLVVEQYKENPILSKYQNLQTEMIELQENYSDVLNMQTELLVINNRLFVETKKLKSAQAVINSKSDKSTKHSQQSKKNVIDKKKGERSYSVGNVDRMVASLQNVQTITITKNDFLGGQIIGN